MLYKDASRPVAERVDNLMSRMTLEEKVAQLTSVWVYEILRDFRFNEDKAAPLLKIGMGQITRLGGASNLLPSAAARTANDIQRFLVEKTRLGIPAIIHEEACSGYLTRAANVFPQAIGVGASFEPVLAEEMGAVIRSQMMALGARQALAPLLDITRDPRWGRTEETYGEDRYLTAQMGMAYIRGLQNDRLEDGILATGKHFVGYGASEGGMNWAPVHLPQRELLETYLYPFEAAVREAGLRSIMPGYHEIDGIPCHTNRWLLQDVLRGQWGFQGLVVSDYFAINMIHDYHGAAADKDDAARMALEAGVDVELPSTDCYAAPLVDAVRQGQADPALVDTSVRRVLEMKFRLGLFESPYVDETVAEARFNTAGNRAYSRRVAEKSMVLLKNNGVLPLSRKLRRIAVIGPNADSVRNMLGDYTYPSHIESQLDQITDNFAGTAVPEDRVSVEEAMPAMDTILEGLRRAVAGAGAELVYAKGCDVIPAPGQSAEEARAGFAEAVEAVRSADVAVVVLGDKAGLITDCTSGEARDCASLELPGEQRALLRAVHATGKPVVLVLVTGRPYNLVWEDANVDAILEAWFPGEEGAAAVAGVLFGDVNPGGKLPITFPRSAGQLPVYYGHRPSGGRSNWKIDYVDESVRPLYPFGHGLSYTSFEYDALCLPAEAPVDGAFEVAFTVANTGAVAGEEVVQLYLHDMLSDVTRPVQELTGFKRVALAPGETRRISFTVSADQLGFFDRAMRFVVEPGDLEVMVGASSADIRLRGVVRLTGEKREVTAKVFASRVDIG
ncbi:MAG: glycoside hydrolase family 3 C-terminal domain-containing protein [Clostridia bacterium]|nr:glycoside hydrolase family 3 C-terminal domain-containing protein [Clostridia bacterium]